jgi:O-antigen/teichoic acid export membrane protein
LDAPSLSYRRLVANVLAGAGGRVAAIATALALATVLVRVLGLSAYGTWSFFFVLIGYNGQFDLGLSVAVERAVARAAAQGDRIRIPSLLNAGLAMSLALSILLQIAVAMPGLESWLARLGDPGVVRACLRVLPACLLCSNAAAVAGAGLTGLQRTTTVAGQRAVMGGITALVVIALAIAGVRRLDVLLVAYAAGLLATAVVSWRAVRRVVPELRLGPGRLEGGAVRELARVGGTLQLTHLVAQAGDQGLRLVLGSTFGPAAIGIYDLASRAAVAPRSLMASLLVALVPFAAAREGAHGTPALSDALRRSTRYATLLIAAGTLAGLSVGGPFMTLWLGASAGGAEDARRILERLLVALALQSMTSPMVALARAAGRPGAEAIATALAQPLGLAAAAHAAGLVDAVTAYAAVTTAAAMVLWWWLKARLGLDGLAARDVVALAIATGGAALAAAAARAAADALAIGPLATLAVVPAVTVITPAALALAAGAISADERRLWRGFALGR